jgi:hypothetical protein
MVAGEVGSKDGVSENEFAVSIEKAFSFSELFKFISFGYTGND